MLSKLNKWLWHFLILRSYNLRKDHTQWTHHKNVTYIRHSNDAEHLNNLVILCHLCVFCSAHVFNLYTYLAFPLGLHDMLIHRECVQASLVRNATPQAAWLLIKFMFVSQKKLCWNMWVYYKCNPSKTFSQQQPMFRFKYIKRRWT